MTAYTSETLMLGCRREGRVCQKTEIKHQIFKSHFKSYVMNLTKIIKTNVLPMLGLGIAAGLTTVSLMSANTVKTQQAEGQFWFEVTSGQPGQEIEQPDPNCPKLTQPDCARLYNEEDTELTPSNERVVISGHESNYVDYRTKTM